MSRSKLIYSQRSKPRTNRKRGRGSAQPDGEGESGDACPPPPAQTRTFLEGFYAVFLLPAEQFSGHPLALAPPLIAAPGAEGHLGTCCGPGDAAGTHLGRSVRGWRGGGMEGVVKSLCSREELDQSWPLPPLRLSCSLLQSPAWFPSGLGVQGSCHLLGAED